MKTIDIHTTHNVVIEKGLASVGQRVGAFVIDFIVLVILIVILTNMVLIPIGSELLLGLGVSLLIFFFNLLMEIVFNGQSLGKLALGIKIVRLDGKELTFSDLFSRWSMRFIDIYMSLGAVAFLTIGASKNGQRIGDKLANTIVIKKKDNSYFSLEEIEKLRSAKDFESGFYSVTRLSDTDVLLIKSTLQRVMKFPTEGNQNAITELSNKVADIMGLESQPMNDIKFLQAVMRDYIALTR